MLIPKAFVLIFSSDPALTEISVWALRIYMGTFLFFGAQIACQQTFIALGQAAVSLFLASARKVILLIPLIFILAAVFFRSGVRRLFGGTGGRSSGCFDHRIDVYLPLS